MDLVNPTKSIIKKWKKKMEFEISHSIGCMCQTLDLSLYSHPQQYQTNSVFVSFIFFSRISSELLIYFFVSFLFWYFFRHKFYFEQISLNFMGWKSIMFVMFSFSLFPRPSLSLLFPYSSLSLPSLLSNYSFPSPYRFHLLPCPFSCFEFRLFTHSCLLFLLLF